MSALPPKADMCGATRDVRFGPIADMATLFDHLVSATGQRKRDGDAERLGGLEVQEQFNFRDLLDRQLARFCALENPAGINADLSICVRTTASIAYQTAGCGELAILEDRRHCVTERQF